MGVVRWLLASLCLVGALVVVGPSPIAAGEPSPDPGSCGGTNFAGEVPCCVSGYVLREGRAVEGARVTIESPHGTVTLITRRSDGWPPHYAVGLSEAPLLAQPGDEIAITAEYKDVKRTVWHKVRPDRQEVNIDLDGRGRD